MDDWEPAHKDAKVVGINRHIIGPECQYDKHDACNGDAWDYLKDEPADCVCECHG